ncbi:cell division protein ZapE [Caulobacter sp. NIBR1757]|uniref:cell division protein ZapE n=1 Tax=Caulobacter sp. NIBR1757 TaxID=3016000 RepID=UPI0022F04D06|nr:cell division protein ZapE [Caulobacter sp. NIBR1757]WGM41166.1 Cell division protein ZapE [Caulobacter sp. NIBR1757]
MPSSVRTAYRDRLKAGEIQPDAAQERAVEALGRLEADLDQAGEPGFSLFGRKPKAQKGVYLWGPVGRGKSMLMDLFFDSAPVARKRRIHFHGFMGEVHGHIDAWRKGDAAARKAHFGQHKGDDPIVPTAELIAEQARLLCFDELQVTDIADAMILGRLFEALFERGVTLVATSNRPPDDLYKDGLNRQLFLPFIDMLKSRMDVVGVKGPTDFRLDRLKSARVWLAPLDPDNERSFDTLWADLLDGQPETGAALDVLGRKVHLPRASGGMVRASFASLCDTALGPNDYLAIAARFHTLFLEDVPRLTPVKRSAARRFNTLVDALYEARVRLVTLAEVAPRDLYPEGEGAFEFERTVSRLEEMQSAGWLEQERD